MNGSPEAKELLKNPNYIDQINQIEHNRPNDFKKRLSDLIEEGKVSKEPNSTEPVIIELEQIEMTDEEVDKNPDAYYRPAHEGQRVEEYYVDEDSVKEIEVIIKDEEVNEIPNESSPIEDEEESSEQTNGSNISDLAPSTSLRPKARPNIISEDKSFAPEVSLKPKKRPDDLSPLNYQSDFTALWDGRSYATNYTDYTLEGLEYFGDSIMNPNIEIDDNGFCGRYNQLTHNERTQFWLTLISSIAKYESGFDTDAKYKESWGLYSRGLFQLGLASTQQRAYSCGFKSGPEINSNPEKSIHCAIKIIDHLVGQDKKIRLYLPNKKGHRRWKGVPRYWAVLRFETVSKAKYNRIINIKRNTQKLPFCSLST